jgi:hypothetical protein
MFEYPVGYFREDSRQENAQRYGNDDAFNH